GGDDVLASIRDLQSVKISDAGTQQTVELFVAAAEMRGLVVPLLECVTATAERIAVIGRIRPLLTLKQSDQVRLDAEALHRPELDTIRAGHDRPFGDRTRRRRELHDRGASDVVQTAVRKFDLVATTKRFEVMAAPLPGGSAHLEDVHEISGVDDLHRELD